MRDDSFQIHNKIDMNLTSKTIHTYLSYGRLERERHASIYFTSMSLELMGLVRVGSRGRVIGGLYCSGCLRFKKKVNKNGP